MALYMLNTFLLMYAPQQGEKDIFPAEKWKRIIVYIFAKCLSKYREIKLEREREVGNGGLRRLCLRRYGVHFSSRKGEILPTLFISRYCFCLFLFQEDLYGLATIGCMVFLDWKPVCFLNFWSYLFFN